MLKSQPSSRQLPKMLDVRYENLGQDPNAQTGTGLKAGYGARNFAGYYTSRFTRFLATTLAWRSGQESLNAGAVYRRPTKTTNGVLAGDAGLMPTYGYLSSRKAPWRGVTYALTPIKESTQNILSQFAATPNGYTGDVPLQLMDTIKNAPPWRRAAARGDSRQSFRSGIMRSPRV